jgi:cytoskeletal protein RodZ
MQYILAAAADGVDELDAASTQSPHTERPMSIRLAAHRSRLAAHWSHLAAPTLLLLAVLALVVPAAHTAVAQARQGTCHGSTAAHKSSAAHACTRPRRGVKPKRKTKLHGSAKAKARHAKQPSKRRRGSSTVTTPAPALCEASTEPTASEPTTASEEDSESCAGATAPTAPTCEEGSEASETGDGSTACETDSED